MKIKLTLPALLISTLYFSQASAELKNEIERINSEISFLKTEIQSVKSQNIYLKEKLDINTPILEQTKDNTNFKVIKILGNKKLKTITITILTESLNHNKSPLLKDFHIIDLEGNKFTLEKHKSIEGMIGGSLALTHNIPIKTSLTFIEVPESTKILKLFKFHYFSAESMKHEDIEFRDLNLNWE